MNLGGWDTMTAAAIPLVNQGLVQSTGDHPRAFSFTEGAVTVAGEFGPWRIIDGGSMQLLHMAFPIVSGTLTGLGSAPVSLAGLEIILEVALRLLPNEANDRVDLTFTTVRMTESTGPAIQPLKLVDPSDRFPFIGDHLVMAALGHALNANLDGFSHILATLQTRGSTDGWLETPFVDWANVRLGDGRHYLAIFGATRKPNERMRLDKVDPALFSGDGSAFFAASKAIFYQKLLAPHLQNNFRPRTRFAANHSGVSAARFRIPFEAATAPRAEGVFDFLKPVVNPVRKIFRPKPPKAVPATPAASMIRDLTVERMRFACVDGMLKSKVNAVALLSAARLMVEVDLEMPFRHDAASGKISFDKDPDPETRHWTEPRKDVDVITQSLGFVVTTVVIALAKDHVSAMVKGITSNMQSFNNPARTPVRWTGIRDFQASHAVLDDCFWFRDDRPV